MSQSTLPMDRIGSGQKCSAALAASQEHKRVTSGAAKIKPGWLYCERKELRMGWDAALRTYCECLPFNHLTWLVVTCCKTTAVRSKSCKNFSLEDQYYVSKIFQISKYIILATSAFAAGMAAYSRCRKGSFCGTNSHQIQQSYIFCGLLAYHMFVLVSVWWLWLIELTKWNGKQNVCSLGFCFSIHI